MLSILHAWLSNVKLQQSHFNLVLVCLSDECQVAALEPYISRLEDLPLRGHDISGLDLLGSEGSSSPDGIVLCLQVYHFPGIATAPSVTNCFQVSFRVSTAFFGRLALAFDWQNNFGPTQPQTAKEILRDYKFWR